MNKYMAYSLVVLVGGFSVVLFLKSCMALGQTQDYEQAVEVLHLAYFVSLCAIGLSVCFAVQGTFNKEKGKWTH